MRKQALSLTTIENEKIRIISYYLENDLSPRRLLYPTEDIRLATISIPNGLYLFNNEILSFFQKPQSIDSTKPPEYTIKLIEINHKKITKKTNEDPCRSRQVSTNNRFNNTSPSARTALDGTYPPDPYHSLRLPPPITDVTLKKDPDSFSNLDASLPSEGLNDASFTHPLTPSQETLFRSTESGQWSKKVYYVGKSFIDRTALQALDHVLKI